MTHSPRLFVDWGVMPKVGFAVRPEFRLICPEYSGRPVVSVCVDRELDCEMQSFQVELTSEGPSNWSFHVPFRMTSCGEDCRPGQYLLLIEIGFPETDTTKPCFFRVQIRIDVPDERSGQKSVLKIEGDGQSLVNLQNYSLGQFSEVVLKGGRDSVINLQDAIGTQPRSDLAETLSDSTPTTFEYQLKIDHEKQARLPVIFKGGKAGQSIDSCGFVSDDGTRISVFSRPEITFGRSRECDVLLRFRPRCEVNDVRSLNISRRHFRASLATDSVVLKNESPTGFKVGRDYCSDTVVIEGQTLSDKLVIEVGLTNDAQKPLMLDMFCIKEAGDLSSTNRQLWYEIYCGVAGTTTSVLACAAIANRFRTVRFDSRQNGDSRESYLLMGHEVTIGGDAYSNGIWLPQIPFEPSAKLIHLGESFWIESLPLGGAVRVNGAPLPPRALCNLQFGDHLEVGAQKLVFTQSCHA